MKDKNICNVTTGSKTERTRIMRLWTHAPSNDISSVPKHGH